MARILILVLIISGISFSSEIQGLKISNHSPAITATQNPAHLAAIEVTGEDFNKPGHYLSVTLGGERLEVLERTNHLLKIKWPASIPRGEHVLKYRQYVIIVPIIILPLLL